MRVNTLFGSTRSLSCLCRDSRRPVHFSIFMSGNRRISVETACFVRRTKKAQRKPSSVHTTPPCPEPRGAAFPRGGVVLLTQTCFELTLFKASRKTVDSPPVSKFAMRHPMSSSIERRSISTRAALPYEVHILAEHLLKLSRCFVQSHSRL